MEISFTPLGILLVFRALLVILVLLGIFLVRKQFVGAWMHKLIWADFTLYREASSTTSYMYDRVLFHPFIWTYDQFLRYVKRRAEVSKVPVKRA